jgi:hypothetical protein
MVLAHGLGNEDRQAPRDEKGGRRISATIGRDFLILNEIIVAASLACDPRRRCFRRLHINISIECEFVGFPCSHICRFANAAYR